MAGSGIRDGAVGDCGRVRRGGPLESWVKEADLVKSGVKEGLKGIATGLERGTVRKRG